MQLIEIAKLEEEAKRTALELDLCWMLKLE